MDNKTVKDRLVEYLGVKRMGQQTFEKIAGLSNGYISNLKRMPGEKMLVKIYAAAQDLNPVWLLSGDGPMLKSDEGAVAVGDAANAQHGDGNTYHNGADAATIDRLIGEMSEQRRSYEKQIDRLLTLLEHRP